MSEYLLGIDVGTTGAKAILVDLKGSVRAAAMNEYAMQTPAPNWTEQNPEDWWQATVASIRAVLQQSNINQGEIAAVGVTGQMHGLVLLDKSGAVLRPCIMWNDQRTAKECESMTATVGAKKLIEFTGNPVLTGFTAPKLLWVRNHEADVYNRIAKILLPKDYVRYRLTGSFFTDVSDASGTSLFDVGKRQWSETILQKLQIPAAWLPDVAESVAVSSRVGSSGARETGLSEGTPVVAGAGDQAAQAVGTGIADEGQVSVTIGTSGVVFAPSDSYKTEPDGKLHAFCHAVPGKWHLMGVMLSAGGSLRWYRDALCASEKVKAQVLNRNAYDVLTGEAASVSPGAEGLLFLPYLSGERTPYADPDARGVFFGLSLRHSKAHMTRALIEGVTFGLRDSLELMRKLRVPVKQVRVSGGGAKSPFWRQILADILDVEIVTVNVAEGAAYGAALLAGLGAGCFKSVGEACSRAVQVTGSTKPGPASSVYDKYYERFRALYAALAGEFKNLSHLAR